MKKLLICALIFGLCSCAATGSDAKPRHWKGKSCACSDCATKSCKSGCQKSCCADKKAQGGASCGA